nr:EamA family transporter [Halomarina oriensis]
MFVLLASLWGLSFPAISVGLASLDPLLFAAIRYDIAAVLLLVFSMLTLDTHRWIPRTRNDVGAVASGGLFLVAGNSLLFVAQQTIPSGVAAILYSLIPLLTTGFAVVVLHERLSAVQLLGIAVGLLGVAIVARPDPNALLAADVVAKGLVVVAAASVALGGVLVQRFGPTLADAGTTGWAMLSGALVLHGASLVTGEGLPAAVPSEEVLFAVSYLGVLATALAFLVYFTLLGDYGPLQTNLVSYLVPVVATVAGAALLGEAVTAATLVGFAVIFLGFLLVQFRSIRAYARGEPTSG